MEVTDENIIKIEEEKCTEYLKAYHTYLKRFQFQEQATSLGKNHFLWECVCAQRAMQSTRRKDLLFASHISLDLEVTINISSIGKRLIQPETSQRLELIER